MESSANDLALAGRLKRRDLFAAALLRWAPWVVFLLVALPAPVYFLFRYFTATEEIGVYMLLALVSLAVSLGAGLIIALLLFLYRKFWEKQLRERLATDGITVDELAWFRSEMKPAERRALKEIEDHSPLLADAYRETLAAKLTAARMYRKSKKESARVERRLREAAHLRGSERGTLAEELRADQTRLERLSRESQEHQAEAETRLQMIEAVAGRRASEAETALAMERLGINRDQPPLALEAARLEREARQQRQQ